MPSFVRVVGRPSWASRSRQRNRGIRPISNEVSEQTTRARESAEESLANTSGTLRSPDGSLVYFENALEFARKNDLNLVSLRNMLNGGSISHVKGWSRPEGVFCKRCGGQRVLTISTKLHSFVCPSCRGVHVLYDPMNKRHNIVNLAEFCRIHDLDYREIWKVLRGFQAEWQGWTRQVPRKKLRMRPKRRR